MRAVATRNDPPPSRLTHPDHPLANQHLPVRQRQVAAHAPPHGNGVPIVVFVKYQQRRLRHTAVPRDVVAHRMTHRDVVRELWRVQQRVEYSARALAGADEALCLGLAQALDDVSEQRRRVRPHGLAVTGGAPIARAVNRDLVVPLTC